jgi:hypothetical protein
MDECVASGGTGGGPLMGRDFAAEGGGGYTTGVYARVRVSDSLAMSPEQIPEHKRLFPDVDVRPDGRPVFENVKQHDNYLKKTGFRKLRQKTKTKSSVRRIA